MDWQEIAALCVVAATALAFVWAQVRRPKTGPHGIAQCGCPPKGEPIKGSIVYHSRKGERPTITVKME